jgi:hypothetical protein
MQYSGDVIILGGSDSRQREADFLSAAGWKINVISQDKPKISYDEWFEISLYNTSGIASVARRFLPVSRPVKYLVNCSGSKLEALIQLQYFLDQIAYSEEIVAAAIDKRFLRLLLSRETLLHTKPIVDPDQNLVIKPVISEIGKRGVFHLKTLNESDVKYFEKSIETGIGSALLFEQFEQGENLTIFYKIENNKIVNKRPFFEEFFLNKTLNFESLVIKQASSDSLEKLDLTKLEAFLEKSVNDGELSICGKKSDVGFMIYEIGVGHAGDGIFENVNFFPDWVKWL